jgi:hypothetical protein
LVGPASEAHPPASLLPVALAADFPIVERILIARSVGPASVSHQIALLRDIARLRRTAALAVAESWD